MLSYEVQSTVSVCLRVTRKGRGQSKLGWGFKGGEGGGGGGIGGDVRWLGHSISWTNLSSSLLWHEAELLHQSTINMTTLFN